MDHETFSNIVEQACNMGLRQAWLTPMLGEIFADLQISEKWALLEKETRIDDYGFYLNFILAREEQIRSFPTLSKLTSLFISLYGFHSNRFVETTRKPASQYSKLLKNLSCLLEVSDSWTPMDGLHFNMRTIKTNTPIMECDTELSALLRKFAAKGANVSEDNEYDSWVVTITQDEVDPLGIKLTDGNQLYMHGTCTKVFAEIQIKADGQVHACACRDIDGSLVVGNLNQTKLKDILSFENVPYRELIESQMQGQCNKNCRSCSSYRSNYDGRASAGYPSLAVMS
jgi:hypothetical protein